MEIALRESKVLPGNAQWLLFIVVFAIFRAFAFERIIFIPGVPNPKVNCAALSR